MSFNDDEGLEKTTASVTFTAYPYKIANYASVHEFVVPAYSSKTVRVPNNSSHRITPTITSNGYEEVLTLNGERYVRDPEHTWAELPTRGLETLKLKEGINEIKIQHKEDFPLSITFNFYEEVF